ncbi:hypothetical protein BK660_25855 [Pseudomonas brassicacearum]|uniref:Uncharacterized protein n=1 Tax=Pseudomonas brassicacearum TaxID=930166 RepID=A0A423HSU0_9PSED|nr:hypothetical protein BK660_25855 [Pseudomonas brassicacearum]
MNNVGVAGWAPLNPWLVAMWLFFDQAFLRGEEASLSTFLLEAKARRNGQGKPVDKSVIKLWKDSAEGRSYWLGAIAAP